MNTMIYETEQTKLSQQLQIHPIDTSKIKLVAGVDIAYWGNEPLSFGVCCIEVIDYHTHEVVESTTYTGRVTFPYKPGFLAYRELPLILKAVETLKNKPDLYMFDGNGYLHERHMGIATHASFYLGGVPTIGVAKTFYSVFNTSFTMPTNDVGAYTEIVYDNEVYGYALRTHENVKPIFLSVGNYIDLDSAKEIVLHLINKESHIPIPTRLADLHTHTARAVEKQKQGIV